MGNIRNAIPHFILVQVPNGTTLLEPKFLLLPLKCGTLQKKWNPKGYSNGTQGVPLTFIKH